MEFLSRLESIEEKYEELSRQMGDPALVGDPDRYRHAAKCFAELEKIVLKYREYVSIRSQIQDAEVLLKDEEMRTVAREEIESLQARRDKLIADLRFLLLPKDPNDEKNVILEIRAGAGGEEASLFAAELFRMYNRYAEGRNWQVEVLSMSNATLGGIKEVIALINGARVYSRL
ncbi:MAG: PCRF domain-containing protein, partial [Acidobacteriota bacterium]